MLKKLLRCTALSVAALSMTAMLSACAGFSANDAAAVGVIGGSDGPTAVFVTGSPLSGAVAIIIPAVILIAIIVGSVIFYLRSRKKK